ncbi:hypothetical protein [Pinisolibacter aquiterrae]|uniref:hypothetical protein n=1 Tax=Pinisolibacter aquiterrae TaxID=2815579 RepID=UPI001C3DFAA7|nr:hypothetical protein [Pinisolibacter aquiterrae]MBV5265131.1 hypothetical protein [Pinisolibacter aquiterrae]MCC8235539.1 hypothetical protein [Pinisolibacter aquiterrae]
MTSSFPPLTRRALLAGLALAPLAGCAGEPGLQSALGLEPPLPRRRFRALKVDASPIAAAGMPAWARRVGDAVRRAATPAFADMIDPSDRKAPVLTLEIDACDFPVYVAGRWRTIPFGSFSGDAHSDWIEGWVTWGTTRRRITASRDAESAGPWSLPDIDQRRLDGVATVFAAWARREFGA